MHKKLFAFAKGEAAADDRKLISIDLSGAFWCACAQHHCWVTFTFPNVVLLLLEREKCWATEMSCFGARDLGLRSWCGVELLGSGSCSVWHQCLPILSWMQQRKAFTVKATIQKIQILTLTQPFQGSYATDLISLSPLPPHHDGTFLVGSLCEYNKWKYSVALLIGTISLPRRDRPPPLLVALWIWLYFCELPV